MYKLSILTICLAILVSCSKSNDFDSEENRIQKIWYKSYYENINEDTAGNFKSTTIDTVNKSKIILNFISDSIVLYTDPMFTRILQGNYTMRQNPFGFTTTLGINVSPAINNGVLRFFSSSVIQTLSENEFIFRGPTLHMIFANKKDNYNSYILYHFISKKQ